MSLMSATNPLLLWITLWTKNSSKSVACALDLGTINPVPLTVVIEVGGAVLVLVDGELFIDRIATRFFLQFGSYAWDQGGDVLVGEV